MLTAFHLSVLWYNYLLIISQIPITTYLLSDTMQVYYLAEQHHNILKEATGIVFQFSEENVNSLLSPACTQTDEPELSSLPPTTHLEVAIP